MPLAMMATCFTPVIPLPVEPGPLPRKRLKTTRKEETPKFPVKLCISQRAQLLWSRVLAGIEECAESEQAQQVYHPDAADRRGTPGGLQQERRALQGSSSQQAFCFHADFGTSEKVMPPASVKEHHVLRENDARDKHAAAEPFPGKVYASPPPSFMRTEQLLSLLTFSLLGLGAGHVFY